MKNISMRDAFFGRLYELVQKDKDIFIVSADMGAPSLDRFRRDFSGQFINVGIAEQNAILVSSGMALEGKKVFVYAIAPFITLRCFEQIKLSPANMNIPLTIVGVGAGFSYEDSGPTHHCVEDLSLLRTLPNLEINNITDSFMAEKFADISCTLAHPNYVRLDREILPLIYKKESSFSEGLTHLVKGKDLYIVATGNMVKRALDVSKSLESKNINAGVIDIYTLPVNKKLFIDIIAKTSQIITIEEHTLPGGFGSALCEMIIDEGLNIPVKRFGLDFQKKYCYKYGSREHLQKLYDLDREHIFNKILEILKNNNNKT